MEINKKKYFGQIIQSVGSKNVRKVKYVYKLDKREFNFNIIIVGFIFIIGFNLIGIIKNVIKFI